MQAHYRLGVWSEADCLCQHFIVWFLIWTTAFRTISHSIVRVCNWKYLLYTRIFDKPWYIVGKFRSICRSLNAAAVPKNVLENFAWLFFEKKGGENLAAPISHIPFLPLSNWSLFGSQWYGIAFGYTHQAKTEVRRFEHTFGIEKSKWKLIAHEEICWNRVVY